MIAAEHNSLYGVAAFAAAPFVEGWHSLVTWSVVALVLVAADLRFGLAAAHARGETIRLSRAVRRTLNKIVDYICWISIAMLLGGAFGDVFGIPVMAAAIMALICAIELSSIFDNFFQSRGIRKHLNVFRLLGALLHADIADALEDDDRPNSNESSDKPINNEEK